MSDPLLDWRGFHTGTHALIDLDAYVGNIALLRAMAPAAGFMAVVKADAYGHGAVECARAAEAAGVEWLGVARINEAIVLRREGIGAPILVLGPPNPSQVEQALAAEVTLAAGSESSLAAIERAAGRGGRPAMVHVKVNTGMNRYGFLPRDVPRVLERLSENREIAVNGIFTHFARADETDLAPTDEQARIFGELVADLDARDICPPWVHQANSAGILTGRTAGTNLVRAGIATYGLSPSDELRIDARFQPIMTVRSVVGRRFALRPGDGVAYGWTYVATEHEEVADIAVGYADGLPRQLANRGWFVVSGRRAPIRGRVCMDQTVVSVQADAAEGDPVTVYGGAPEAMSLEEVGALVGTNNYEIATQVMSRVPRVYLRDGSPFAWEHRLLGERGRCVGV